MSSDSGYKVPYTSILEVKPHGNADKLEVVTIYGFQVITQKGRYKVGDKVIYIPIDSILPKNIEDILFPENSKVKLKNSRVRQIKLRGLASQGMCVNPKELEGIVNFKYIEDEQDLQKVLNICKYEPEEKGPSQPQSKGSTGRKKLAHPDFHCYNGLGNIKWFPNLFAEGEQVVIQEKLHGTNARASLLPFRANTLLKKIKSFLGLAPKEEKLYGSNRVDITNSSSYTGFYGEDIYGAVFSKLDVFSKLKLGETVFGEIIGPGVQKNYSYGLKEHKFVLFDVKVLQADGSQVWLSPEEVQQFAIDRGFDFVPVLYKGPYNKELTYSMTKGRSAYDPGTEVREGIVIKARDNYSIEGNKKALKWVSEDYLNDNSNTDFH